MIKRRFYKLEHGDRDAPSESSSSSDDSELEAAATEDEEEYEYEEEDDNDTKEEEDDNDTKEEEDDVARLTGGNESSSGYESEDSSANEVNPDSSGLPSSDEDVTTLKDTKISGETHLLEKGIADLDNARNNSMPEEDDIPRDALDYVLKCKSVFKCRICPRIVCLTVQTLNAHLKSKRHARSEKLLKEGRLKVMLTEDGRIEGEIHPEEDSPIRGQQNPSASKKKSKGLKRQHKGKKFNENEENILPMDNAIDSRKNQSKKRQKNK
ncbi:PREDICTED: protein PFC0760c isoform X3 [Nicotiana attenuata]|uniref:protein PFC0760c isoform X3 n=1 Tax=Nicotiana attenuata TaxID=49451 RepID=UPI000904E1B8|nr:PREDICTED: protein PFC0760c isoform X3 [Nicotiana attenuata]